MFNCEVTLYKEAQVAALADRLGKVEGDKTLLFLDIQGHDGAVSVLSIIYFRASTPFLVDVQTLGDKAFSTPGPETGRTLRDILESSDIKKAFFDVRGQAHALHRSYGIRLGGVQDLQLLELVLRGSADTRSVLSIADIVLKVVGLEEEEADSFQRTLRRREKFDDNGFSQRPLAKEATDLCKFGVVPLNIAFCRLNPRLKQGEMEKVTELSKKWVDQGQAADFKG